MHYYGIKANVPLPLDLTDPLASPGHEREESALPMFTPFFIAIVLAFPYRLKIGRRILYHMIENPS